MKRYLILFSAIIILGSCYQKSKKAIYQTSSEKYLVSQESTNGQDTLQTFYDFNDPSIVKMVGFTKDGLRNGEWIYNLKSGIDTINWAHYKDKYLSFETNVFTFIDSIKHGDFYTKFLYKVKNERIILSVSINGPLKDSLPESNYKRISEREMNRIGIKVISFDIKKIADNGKNIYLGSVLAKKPNGELITIKGAYGFIDPSHFIELSVSCSKKSLYTEELFNAVFSAFYINGKRFYQPIASE